MKTDKNTFPDIDISKFNIDENGNVLRCERMKKILNVEQENERLKQENAELKDDNKVMADNYSKMEQKFFNQLTKLKGIVKRFLEFVNNEVEYDPENPEVHTKMWNELCEEAEQFLKDSEVEE